MNQGKNVRRLRQLSDLKQWQLAKMISVTSQRMSVIEQTPVLELELKKRIANALNTTVEEIEGGGGQTIIPNKPPKNALQKKYAISKLLLRKILKTLENFEADKKVSSLLHEIKNKLTIN